MKTKNDDLESVIIYHDYAAVQNSVADITVRKIDAAMLPDIGYKPMCYLQCSNSFNGTFPFYAFIIVPKESSVGQCEIKQVNAYNYVTLTVNPGSDPNAKCLFFLTITGMPAPLGYKMSSVELTVIGNSDSSGGVGTPPQGQGKTAVDYQDADDEPDASTQKA